MHRYVVKVLVVDGRIFYPPELQVDFSNVLEVEYALERGEVILTTKDPIPTSESVMEWKGG